MISVWWYSALKIYYYFFASSNNYFVESLGFSTCKIMSSVNKNKFTSLLYRFFYCLIAPARTSRSTLNRRDESRPPCFGPDLKKKVFRFFFFPHWVCYVIYGLFIYGIYYVEVFFFYSWLIKCFLSWKGMYFVKCFFLYPFINFYFLFCLCSISHWCID